jgi:curved DNA-binding protein CbpA
VQTYYDILQVSTSCSQEDVKRAFRRRAKELHPDVAASNRRSVEEMRLLIEAYETLIDPELRREYDRTRGIVPEEYRFDYREFLRKRTHDLVSQSKLIFFDLLHSNEDEAVRLFDRLNARGTFDLSDHLDREDFMDCAFLLAEEYERRESYIRAFELLLAIVYFEREKPYFRHFFVEVVDRLRNLVCFKMPDRVSADLVLDCLEQLIDQDFSRKETAFFYKKAAELHLDRGSLGEAVSCLDQGLAMDSKLAGVKRLRERIEFVAAATT